MAEGLATRLLGRRRAGDAARTSRSSRSTPARCSPARGSAATSKSASRRSSRRCARGRRPILFIDEIHATVGAGAVTGGTMDLATLMKPLLTAGDLRVIGSTTFEEFKQIEKDRALARRLQKIAIDEPSIDETVRILAGLRSRYEEHHRVKYTDAALEAAAKLAARHLRDYRLPDSAIDLIDEAGAVVRLKTSARSTRHAAGRRRRHRADRRADGAHPRAPGVLVRSRAAADARGVARARRLRPARGGAPRRAGDQAIARRARRSPIDRPAASCSPARPASARPSSRSSSRCSSATSSSAST